MNDYVGPHNSIDINNPEKKKESDWWDELCKMHNEENHWPKGNKKIVPKQNDGDYLNK